MGQRWTSEEIAHAVQLKYLDFVRLYPERSYTAWASARHLAKQAADEVDERTETPLGKLTPESRRLYDEMVAGAHVPYTSPGEGLDDILRHFDRRTPVSDMIGRKARFQQSERVDDLRRAYDAQAAGNKEAYFIGGERREHADERPTPAAEAAEKPLVNYLGYEMEETASDEELLDALIRWQDVRNRACAQKLEHRVDIPVRDGKPIAVCFPSDWHIGNTGTDHKRIIEDNKLIMGHPRLYCALGGDPVDNFIIEKMISASRTQVAQVDVQWRLFRHLVAQLVESNSLLFVGAGNHDAWTQKVAGLDGISAALRGLPVVNTGEGGFIRLRVGDVEYGVYRKHKPTRFNSKQNPTHFLKQMLRMGTPWDFDIGISEHFHDCNIEQGEYRPGTGRHRVFVTTGSYKVKDEYSESLGYYGGGYGVPCVVLWPDRREMLPVMKIEQAIRLVDSFS